MQKANYIESWLVHTIYAQLLDSDNIVSNMDAIYTGTELINTINFLVHAWHNSQSWHVIMNIIFR